MIEIKVPEEEQMPPNNHSREEAHGIIKLLVNAYNIGYKDGVEAYKTMMELEKEECDERVSCTECEHYDQEKHYCPRFCSVIRDAVKESEEPAEWIVNTDESRRWDRVRFYCSACNGWNTYGKSKYCPNCGRRMQSDK